MKRQSNQFTTRTAIIGTIIIALILIPGTYWLGRIAGRDTEAAVRNVSLLYLDELAGRREQVVASKLSDYINDMNIAISLLEKEDLSSPEKLQAYQARMKQLYGLEKFAFVDENGLIYTSQGTRKDIDCYEFDYQNLSQPEISMKNADGNDKMVIIAVPTDRLPFENQHLVVCFMEINMNYLSDSISLQSGSNNTTFCNLYSKDGRSLTNMVLGGLASEDNLLHALDRADIEAGRDFESLCQDFAEGNSGFVSFTYNGIKETMYYVPVHRTDWMLTYLIRESVISDQISAISEGIVQRSLLLSLLSALVLVGIFALIVAQTKKTAQLTLEKETSELMQQELEERLALQDELLDQEKTRTQQDSMITALASDYRSVYYVDLDTDNCICYRNDDKTDKQSAEGAQFAFHEAFAEYAEKYVAPDYRKAFLAFIQTDNIRSGLEKEPIIAYRYLVKKDETERYEMLRMAGVRHPEDRDDHIIHAVGVGFTDIDAEMRESMSMNQALSDALKAAEEASKAKTVFLSSMSHEIRTPMNAIIGLDSLALNDPDISASTRDYLEKIGSSAQHLLSLINDILDMSRIESGRMVLRNEEFSFAKLLEQINVIFSGQCQEKGLEYDCRINGQLADYFIGDSTKLRQVLINILGNAVKFTPAGGRVSLTVEKTAGFDNKSTLRFVIRDTGIGMSKEYLPKIFDTFSQEDASATNKYGSSGLGMAITRRIVDMMNGKIEVDSEKGKGTTFTVIVTLLDSERTAHAPEQEEILPQDMQVLVIDDDPLACDQAKLVLEKAGIACEAALSGQSALDMIKVRHARRNPYNLIIVDWKMPDMDGVETTRQIRSVIDNESAIIILSAYNWEEVLDEAIAAGVDSFVSKPLFSETLLEEFRKALEKKRLFSRKDTAKADLKGRHILLAEDVDINAEILCSILETRDITTDRAENGRLAVELFTSHPEGYYDAILMDMRMPEMDGLEATGRIRAMNRADASSIPIIALTANAFDEDVQQSLQAGLNAHLTKPVQPDTLFETLENLIRA